MRNLVCILNEKESIDWIDKSNPAKNQHKTNNKLRCSRTAGAFCCFVFGRIALAARIVAFRCCLFTSQQTVPQSVLSLLPNPSCTNAPLTNGLQITGRHRNSNLDPCAIVFSPQITRT